MPTVSAAAGASGSQPAATNEVVAPPPVAQPAATQEVVAPTTIRQPDANEGDVSPTTILQRTSEEVVVAHAAAAQDVSSGPIQPSTSTQSGSLMLRSYAFEDTRSGYYDDYDLDYPLI